MLFLWDAVRSETHLQRASAQQQALQELPRPQENARGRAQGLPVACNRIKKAGSIKLFSWSRPTPIFVWNQAAIKLELSPATRTYRRPARERDIKMHRRATSLLHQRSHRAGVRT